MGIYIMKIREILEIENKNTDSINLFRAGLFWRCYEYSAWRFVKNIKDYRLIRRFVKIVDQDIVYLGFPDSALLDILGKVNNNYNPTLQVQKTDQSVIIHGFVEMEGFEQWKENIKKDSKKIVFEKLSPRWLDYFFVDDKVGKLSNKGFFNNC